MNLFWKRKIRIQVAGLTITAPHIAIDIRRESNATRPAGNVTIHNLNRDHERDIHERGRKITVAAGYGEALGLLFDGIVLRVDREREGLSRKTKIALGGQSLSADRGVTNRSYSGPVKLRQVVRDLASDLKMTTGPLDAIPEALEVPYWAYSGATNRALNKILSVHGLAWYDDDGVVRVTSPGVAQSDGAEMLLSPATGLIGAPTVTHDGQGKRSSARARSLLNPVFALGGKVNLESETLKGLWKISALRHHGDNWTATDFYTEMELKKL